MDEQNKKDLLKFLIDEFIADRFRYLSLLQENSLTQEGINQKTDLKQLLDLLKKLNIIDSY